MIHSIFFLEFAFSLFPWLLFDIREKIYLFISAGFSMLLIMGQSNGVNLFPSYLDKNLFTNTFINEITYVIAGTIIVLSLYFFQKKSFFLEMNNLRLLRESKQHLSEIAENIQDAILFWSQTEGNIYSNTTFEKIMERGISKEENGPDMLFNWIVDEDRDWVREKITQKHVKTTNREIDLQFRIFTPEGKIKWLWLREKTINGNHLEGNRFITLITDITKIKHIQNKLHQKTKSLERYERKVKDLFKIMQEGVVRTNVEGKFIECNHAFCQLTGFTENELQTMNFKDITPDKYYNFENNVIINQVLQHGYSEPYFKEYKTKSGTFIPVEIQVYLSKEDGRASGMWGIIRDLRQKYKYESIIRQQERYFAQVIENMPLAVMLVGVDENIISINKAFNRVFGYNLQELPDLKTWYQFAFPDDKTRSFQEKEWNNILMNGQDSQKNTSLNIKIRSKSRVYKEVETWMTVLDDRIVIIYNDVTEKSIAQQKTRESMNMLQLVLNTIPVRVFWKDVHLNYLGCNQQFANDAGLTTPDEIIGKNDFELSWIENAELYQSIDQKVIGKQHSILNFEEPQVDRQGNHKWLKTSKIPLRDAEGRLMGVLGVYENITEFKKNQEELTLYRKKLEKLVEERTSQLTERTEKLEQSYQLVNEQKQKMEEAFNKLKETQSQLIQSEKMASIGLLTAGIAHEINNPINFISAGMHGLKAVLEDVEAILNAYSKITIENAKTTLPEIEKQKLNVGISELLSDVHTLTGNIENGINRTVEIIKSLLNFARTDEKNLHSVNIHESIDSTLVLLHNHYKKRITIVKKYGTISLVEAYPDKLNQVFMNILMNAIQSIDEQGEIVITTLQKSDRAIHIQISDTGHGIASNNIRKIFDPFFTTKEKGSGTGLGLSISYNIIKQHKGEILVESAIGKGTTFTIKLPVSQAFNK
jgi:PAS domain S-box-containing protein